MAHKKAQAVHNALLDELKLRLPTLTIVESVDSNGDPTIQIGAGTTGTKSFFVRTKNYSWPLAKDSLGNTSQTFSQSVIQVATEANFAGTTDNVADYLTPVELLPFWMSVIRRGTRVEHWVETNGTGPSVTTFNTAAKMISAQENDIYGGSAGSQ